VLKISGGFVPLAGDKPIQDIPPSVPVKPKVEDE
jgi:hypothetical protein